MSRFTTLVGNLTEAEADWLLSVGVEKTVRMDEVVIAAGEPNTALMIVQEGVLGVFSSPDGKRIAVRGPGEIFGEMSLVEKELPSVTVKALEQAVLLVIPHAVLEQRFASDSVFAAHFYLTMARVLSSRLRVSNSQLHVARHSIEELLVGETWRCVAGALEQFKDRLHRIDKLALTNFGEIPDDVASQLTIELQQFFLFLDAQIGDRSPENQQVKDEIGAYVQKELLPYIALTEAAERSYSKPRGYTGDYMTIEMFYQNCGKGVGRLGPLIDQCFLAIPPVQAVRNRRSILAGEIRRSMLEKNGETTYITSMASGPAEEIFDVYQSLEKPEGLKSTLIDFDLQALAFVSDRRDRSRLHKQITLVNENLIFLALGRTKTQICNQDLIYSVGLIDYFDDDLVVKLLSLAHSLLRPGGRVIVGNFHPCNQFKTMMDYVMDWRLIHRDEQKMDELFTRSAFNRPCTKITFEEQGINLFAECVRV